MPGGFSSGFNSGFGPAVATVAVARPAFVAAPPRPTVALAVDFILITHMTAAVVADDEAMVLAMLGLPGDEGDAGLELDLLFN